MAGCRNKADEPESIEAMTQASRGSFLMGCPIIVGDHRILLGALDEKIGSTDMHKGSTTVEQKRRWNGAPIINQP